MQLTTIWIILAAAATVMAAPIVLNNHYNAHNPINHGRVSFHLPSVGIQNTFAPSRGTPRDVIYKRQPPPAAPVQHDIQAQSPRPVRPAQNTAANLEAQVGGQRPRPPTPGPNSPPPLVHGGPSPPDTAGPRTPQNPQGHH